MFHRSETSRRFTASLSRLTCQVRPNKLDNVLRSFGQLIAPSNYGRVCSRGKLKSLATGPTMPTCALGVTCDARCHQSLRLRRLDVAGSGFHRALPEQPRESGDRPSCRILGSM